LEVGSKNPEIGTCSYKSYQFPLPVGGLTNKKIFLLKTPKTGGTTFAGILRRIADNYNLTTIYPVHGYSTFRKFSELEMAADYFNITIDQIDVLCNHMYFNSEDISKILGPNYYKVGLFRDPISRGISGYYHSRSSTSFCPQFSYDRWAHECIYFHNGLFAWYVDKSNPKSNYLKNIQQFDHIIVNEFFTESLMVFMHKMNLRLTDLLYQSSKTQMKNLTEPLTQEQLDVLTSGIEQWNQLESEIYHDVCDQLQKEYESLPDHYIMLRQIFEEMLEDVQNACLKDPKNSKDCYWRDNGCAKTCIKNWVKENVICNEP